MQEIYIKIQMAEEYLHDLRKKLEVAEEDYRRGVKGAASLPYVLATATLPFVNSTCASARAAALSAGVKMR
jgi:hypothetical protein